jgi:hypothetical protein
MYLSQCARVRGLELHAKKASWNLSRDNLLLVTDITASMEKYLALLPYLSAK